MKTILLLALAACGPKEGQRCNPLQFENECENGFECVYPANCGVAYCCAPTSRVATCQPCPAADGGIDGGG